MDNESSALNHEFFITNIQRFSVNDGPGIRTTVFLKGCPLKCAWCHNPETIQSQQEFFFDEEKCVRCGACAEACPEDAIRPPLKRKFVKDPEVKPLISSSGSIIDKINNGTFGSEETEKSAELLASEETAAEDVAAEIAPPKFDRDKCARCMSCVKACIYGALSEAGRLTTVEDVFKEVLKDEPFYESSGGGMTISGGEPLLQPEVTRALLKRAHEAGIHTALDTTGLAKWETIEKMLPYVDLVLFDIKSLDDRKHRKWTGVSNQLILENVKKIANAGTKIRIRCVIIHDVNYWDPEYARGIAEFARSLGDSVMGIDLMPYHNFADKKYEKLGRDHFFKGFPNINREDLDDYLDVMDKEGRLKPTIGGMIGTEKKSEE